MAYQALYRKYRPCTFDDFIDQEYIKETLINSIVNNKISHAYLFSGPRGIGKTSMAKIFAKAINCCNFTKNNDVCGKCENCTVCDNSVDVIEIDAASNNGVDQIRELKNKVSIVPSQLKYKVYIIDEVHMLTNSAFNALLKTLEEPPSYVVFILATTEFYEVPETIVSRCQCFNFSRISLNSLCDRLKYIAKKEKISIEDDAIVEIAKYSNGGLRDAIGMLDKLNSFTNSKITLDIFKEINGLISSKDVEEFYNGLINNDAKCILDLIEKINSQGYDFKNFIERLMILTRDKIVEHFLHKSELVGTVDDNIKLVEILNDILVRLKSTIDPIVIVQIYFLKYMEDKKIISQEIIEEKKMSENTIEKKLQEDKNVNKKALGNKALKLKLNEEVKQIRINNALATANLEYKKELNLVWKNLQNYFMDQKYGKIAQLLYDATPMVVGSSDLIIVSHSDAVINKLYSNFVLLEAFISNIYRDLKVVIIKENDFDGIKNKYIEDKKNKIDYEVKEECGKLVEEVDDLINQAINVFGKDVVDIE